jgi:hypothetical protein
VNKTIIFTTAISTTLAIMLGVVASPFLEILVEPKIEKITESPAREAQSKFLLDVAKLIQYADSIGIELTGGELFRTRYQQRRNIIKGTSWTMNSLHMKRRAIDLNIFINGKYIRTSKPYRVLAIYWEELSPYNRAGIRFNDGNHFERRLNKDWKRNGDI